MKINKININCHKTSSSGIERNPNFTFFLFRSPIVFSSGGESKVFTGSSSVISSNGFRQEIRPLNNTPLKYDYVNFQTSSTDRQYIVSMNIPLDVPVEITDDFVISSTLKSMKSAFLKKGKHYTEFMELSMRIIFISLSEMFSAKPDIPSIPKYQELKALRDAIFEEPMKEWSADEICYNMAISRAYFHRLYYTAFGTTYRQDVIYSRILYACELLKNTDLSISEIAEKCGYDSDSYFMRQFRQHQNCTPSEYRKIIKNENS
ncbi:MAG: AraC family transcriptional regulator [Ruminococcus sp.]|nr:AraC family transcriptional regulator [Ruminococcus sp.]MDE7138863.1 AraC family transcriptional regulator [Ruminococcus sp.]